MTRILGLVESPAQLLNAVEWAYAQERDAGTPRDRVHLVILGPTDAVTRFQLHRVAEIVRADGFSVGWCEARTSAYAPMRAVTALGPLARSAEVIVLGDPYSGMAHLLLNLARPARVVVVDDGTATLHYAKQWADGLPLQRWHLATRSRAARRVGGRAQRLLGDRSDRVELFTAMPVTVDMPRSANAYAWTRARFPDPRILPGTDLMGSSLVETGTIAAEPYLAGVRRLAADRGLRRYLPHRKETPEKLAAIRAAGLELIRPDLPMELYARRGPIGGRILSFPSTVLHTLPLVLAGSPVRIEPLGIEEGWFTGEADDVARGFLRGI